MKCANKKILMRIRFLIITMLMLSMEAFANTNPFTVFDSSSTDNNAQTANNAAVSIGASQNSSQTASQGTAVNNVPVTRSPYVQMKPLTAPATNVPQKALSAQPNASSATTVQINPNAQPLPANRYNAASTVTGSTIGLPISGSGEQGQQNVSSNNLQSAVVPGGSILQVLNMINQSVGTINTNLTTWKAKKDKDQVGAGAQLVSTTPENLKGFLAGRSGFMNASAINSIWNVLSTEQMRNVASGVLDGDVGISVLLAPIDIGQLQAQLSNRKSDSSLSGVMTSLEYQKFSSQYTDSLIGSLVSQIQGLDNGQMQVLDLIKYAISQVSMQTKIVKPQVDSEMSLLRQAVQAPYVEPGKGKPSWFDQLQTASTPQLLRSLAILLATQNQIQYMQLQNEQLETMIQAGQLAESVNMNIALVQLNTKQNRTNDLLNKILNQLVAQNSKK